MLLAGYLIAWPISKPLATIGVGQSANTFFAAARSMYTLYSFCRLFGPNIPAIIDSDRHLRATSSRPVSFECASAGDSIRRARFVENPTTAITTDPSGCAA